MTNDNAGHQPTPGLPPEPNPWGQPQQQPQPAQPQQEQQQAPQSQQPQQQAQQQSHQPQQPEQQQAPQPYYPPAPQSSYPPVQQSAPEYRQPGMQQGHQQQQPYPVPHAPALPFQPPAVPPTQAAPTRAVPPAEPAPSTEAYPQQPAQGGYPQQPTTGAYPQQAVPAGGLPTQGGGYPPQPPVGAYPAGSTSPSTSPKKKKKLMPWIAGGSAVVLLAVAGIVGFSMGSAAHAPELEVKAYLDALKKGDVAGAFEVSGTKVEKTDLLLTKKAYAEADDRIIRYTLGEVTTDDDTATVTASITQGGEKYDQEFTLVKDGKEAVFFDNWQLEAPKLSSIAVGANAPDEAVVEVAGVDVSELEKDGGVYTLRALPGTYSVALGGDVAWYSAEELTASVVGFGVEADAAEAQILEITMTEEGTTAATDAVNTWLDACIASTELAPTGCPFYATNTQGYEISNLRWTVTKPTFSIGEFADGTWAVTTDSDGSAQAAADARDPSSGATGPISTEPFPFDVDGIIEAFGDDGATFVFTS